MNVHPPKWADRFLAWYCNPELLEEIQGDAHELYALRLKEEGATKANLKFIFDVIRFFRWSNIRRTRSEFSNGPALWNFNFKMAARHAGKNKLLFAIRILGLAVCLSFTLLLTAFVANELSFDRFHERHDNIYRATSKVSFGDRVTRYAVTPLPLGPALAQHIPEVEACFRFMYFEKPVLRRDDKLFYQENVLAADSNFLRTLSFPFRSGDERALAGADKIVLTGSLAKKIFGDEEPLGKTLEFGNNVLLEVAAVIEDVPANSHLHFDALISWETFNFNDEWSNLNAYNYIVLKPGHSIGEVERKMPALLKTYHDQIAQEYNARYEAVFEPITGIHFSPEIDEDIARKGNRSNLLILVAMGALFFASGLINHLNLTLAGLTASLKRISVIRVFGGRQGSHQKMLLSDTLFTLLLVVPLVSVLLFLAWQMVATHLSIRIRPQMFIHPAFLAVSAGAILLILFSAKVNAFVLTRAGKVTDALKGKLDPKDHRSGFRKMLVSLQLSFSIVIIGVIGVFADQFRFIQEADKGFDPSNTVVLKLRGADLSTVEAFCEEVRQLPGIAAASASSYYPGVVETKYVFQVETDKGTKQVLVPQIHCGPDYLDMLHIRVIRGRSFDRHRDEQNGAFIINEAAAREFGWKDGVGKKIRGPLSGSGESNAEGEVIGVVKDFNFASLHSRIEPLIIFLTDENWGNDFFYLRLDPLHPAGVMASLEEKYKALWPELPFEWEYLDLKYQSLYRKDLEVKQIFNAGLVISLVTSCLGIFSISALVLMLRTKEMGIRKVVGAGTFQLFLLHTKSFFRFALIAALIAFPAIWFLAGEWLESFSYHVELHAGYLILPGLTALIIVLVTTGYHGISTARINVVDTLKHE